MKVVAVVLAAFLATSSNGQEYECRTGRSCRCSSSNRCQHESKYGLSYNECRDECNDEGDDCKGFEWTDNSSDSDDDTHCEIHEVAGNRYSDESQDRSDTTCCWKLPEFPTPRPTRRPTPAPTPAPTNPRPTPASTPAPTPAPTEPKDDKGGKRQRDRARNFLRKLRFDEDGMEQTEIVDNNFF